MRTFNERICPHISSPSPNADRSSKNSIIASLLYSFPRSHDTMGSCNGRYCANIYGLVVNVFPVALRSDGHTLDRAQKNHRARV
jgi:hypothetical protein